MKKLSSVETFFYHNSSFEASPLQTEGGGNQKLFGWGSIIEGPQQPLIYWAPTPVNPSDRGYKIFAIFAMALLPHYHEN